VTGAGQPFSLEGKKKKAIYFKKAWFFSHIHLKHTKSLSIGSMAAECVQQN
jgi:hypothetical protein